MANELKKGPSIYGLFVNFPPKFLAVATFVGGIVLLFSGSVPAETERLKWLQDIVPLPVIEISHFLGSLAGVGLLFLAWGLMQRLDGAYVLTLGLLASGVLFSLLKGFDYEEAAILTVMFLSMLPARKYFYRRSSLLAEPLQPGWIGLMFLVFGCSLMIGIVSYQNVEYSHDLWWKFTLHGGASRFLRATVGAAALLLILSLRKLIEPARPRFFAPSAGDLENVRAIVEKSPKCFSKLALLGDKQFLFSAKRDAFLMYRIRGKSWIALGDPIGPEEEWKELLWEFRRLSDSYHGWTVFSEIGKDNLPLYLDLGLTLAKLGEEARVFLDGFSCESPEHRDLRYTRKKLEEKGFSFEWIPAGGIGGLREELKSVSDGWLKGKHTKEKGFSLGFFDASYLDRFRVGIVRTGGKIIAFTNVWEGAGKEEFGADLMRYLPEASPNGIMDYLFLNLILWGKNEGYRVFNMGNAPLSGLEARELAPLWHRFGAFIYTHAENFYNFQGLRQYKEKFKPRWEPKYLASPGGLFLPLVLADFSGLVSGGLKGLLFK